MWTNLWVFSQLPQKKDQEAELVKWLVNLQAIKDAGGFINELVEDGPKK